MFLWLNGDDGKQIESLSEIPADWDVFHSPSEWISSHLFADGIMVDKMLFVQEVESCSIPKHLQKDAILEAAEYVVRFVFVHWYY